MKSKNKLVFSAFVCSLAAAQSLYAAPGAAKVKIEDFAGKYQAQRGDCPQEETLVMDYAKIDSAESLMLSHGIANKQTKESFLRIGSETSEKVLVQVAGEKDHMRTTQVSFHSSEEDQEATVEKYVSLRDLASDEEFYFEASTLSLSFDKKHLVYKGVDGDGENDPHEYVCEYQRVK